jgi:hypothetical protein
MSTATTNTSAPSVTGTYSIDPIHSRIGFVACHAVVTKVRGSFNDFDDRGYFDAENPGQLAAGPDHPGGQYRQLATPTGTRTCAPTACSPWIATHHLVRLYRGRTRR